MTFEISNKTTGVNFGLYQGATAAEALDAYARDAGYRDYAAACEVASGEDIVAREVVTKIRVDAIGGHPVNVVASRSMDDDGWVIVYGPKGERISDYYADDGGAWRLQPDGTIGRQLLGTCQVRAPRDARTFEPWLRQRIGLKIDVFALDY